MQLAPTGRRLGAIYKAGLVLGLIVSTIATTASAQILDPALPAYRPVNDLSGHISLMGSTTMTNMAAAWTDSFQQFYPNVQKTLEIRGSRNAVPAVMSGDATLGLLSRKVYQSEIAAFNEKFGYDPTVITVCKEHIAIYTHPENPIRSLTLLQLQSILAGKTKTWGELGVTGPWAPQPIRVHGRAEDTGSRVYLEQALRLGESHAPTYEYPTNSSLVASIAKDKLGLGYAGLIYNSDEIKAIPIAPAEGQPAIGVDSLAAAQGQYWLMRPLQLVINHKPGTKIDPAAEQFIEYVLSRTGQQDVIRAGFQPIVATTAEIAHERLDTGIIR